MCAAFGLACQLDLRFIIFVQGSRVEGKRGGEQASSD